MKRVADKQLSKDNDGEEDDVQEVSGEGFKKADERTLAGRKIRALPKRSTVSTLDSAPSITPSTTDTESKPRFSGFIGFGAPAAPPSGAFSFTAPKPAATTSPLFGSGTPAQNVSPSASSATKAFASFLGKPSQPEVPPSAPKVPAPTSDEPDAAEVTYYLALRGLNESFLSAVKQAIEKDPFFDLTTLFDQYKRHRTSEEGKHDAKSKSSKAAPPAPKYTPPVAPEPPKAPSLMPTPPSSFSGFGGFDSSSSSSLSSTPTPSSGGFTPKADSFTDAPKSAFTLPPSTNGFGSGFSFSKPVEPKPDSSTPSTSTGFSFGKSSSESTDEKSKPPSTTGFSFGSSSFGAKDSTTSKDSQDTKEKATVPSFFTSPTSGADKPTSAFGGSSSGFGSSSSPSPFGSSTSLAFRAPSSTPTTFGASAAAGSFGFMSKPGSSGSIGNPVGFGFGTPPKTDSPGDKPGFASNGFSFAKSADTGSTEGGSSSVLAFGKPAEAASASAGGAGEETSGSIANGESSAVVLGGPNPHDVEGEGEEGEETTHEIKAKAFKLKTDKEGKTLWAEMGVGMFRLKRHKETDGRRMLMRNSSTGKVMINANLYSGLNPSVTKKTLKFVAHDEDSNPHTYTLRVGTEVQAGELKDAFEREIAFVKAKTGD